MISTPKKSKIPPRKNKDRFAEIIQSKYKSRNTYKDSGFW
jgi:hypothetical protein